MPYDSSAVPQAPQALQAAPQLDDRTAAAPGYAAEGVVVQFRADSVAACDGKDTTRDEAERMSQSGSEEDAEGRQSVTRTPIHSTHDPGSSQQPVMSPEPELSSDASHGESSSARLAVFGDDESKISDRLSAAHDSSNERPNRFGGKTRTRTMTRTILETNGEVSTLYRMHLQYGQLLDGGHAFCDHARCYTACRQAITAGSFTRLEGCFRSRSVRLAYASHQT